MEKAPSGGADVQDGSAEPGDMGRDEPSLVRESVAVPSREFSPFCREIVLRRIRVVLGEPPLVGKPRRKAHAARAACDDIVAVANAAPTEGLEPLAIQHLIRGRCAYRTRPGALRYSRHCPSRPRCGRRVS